MFGGLLSLYALRNSKILSKLAVMSRKKLESLQLSNKLKNKLNDDFRAILADLAIRELLGIFFVPLLR